MIAPALMYIDQLRTTWKRALAITVGVALTSAVVTSGIRDWKTLPEQIVYSLIASFCVGPIFWLEGPLFVSLRRLRAGRAWAIRITLAAITMNVGISIGLAVLAALNVLPW